MLERGGATGDASAAKPSAAKPSAAELSAAGAPDEPVPAYPSLVRAVRFAAVALGALPWCLPLARSWLPLGAVGVALDHLFVPMCHRMPERSLTLGGVMMPLCSRCAGIFAGMAAGAAIARPRFPMRVWRPLLVVLGALMAVDVAAQDLGLHPVSHSTRLATGLAFGYGVTAAFLTQLARRRC